MYSIPIALFRLFLPAQRYASAGNSDRNVSIRLSVTEPVLCQNEVVISSPSGSPTRDSSFLMPTFITTF